ncbi:MAG: GntR family transcriptional regulator [Thermoleophilia bacterium]|nr:GntR family transcriptional regulator [Thermoleophilia bacterium]
MVDTESGGIPLYYQIASLLRTQIENGDFGPGDRIPTENELTEIYSVSRVTVRQALASLVGDGYLVRKKAKGTFVAPEVPVKSVVELAGHFGDLVSSSSHYVVKLLDLDQAVPPKRVADFLDVGPGEPVTRIRRIRFHRNIPFSYIVNYLPLEFGELVTRAELERSPLMKILEDHQKLDIRKGTQIMEAAAATAQAADLLQIPLADPVLLVTVAVYLGDGRPVDLTEFVFRSDVFRYRVDLVRFRAVDESGADEIMPSGRWRA